MCFRYLFHGDSGLLTVSITNARVLNVTVKIFVDMLCEMCDEL